ncbi:RCC1 and BTB domain-containing protein 2-like [Oppia nitens]|uniref:RCC1 and BTB domain-containing protein 2-like n=1 Tax=Oppia nitens TaxID=1686743 RepID=UPI0023DABBEA|nr:RCC1 and BTB domain-containing protein 2-like [Oppia nitens]
MSSVKQISTKGSDVQKFFNASNDLLKDVKTVFVFNDINNKMNAFLVTNDDKTYTFGGNFFGVLGLGHKNPIDKLVLNKKLSQISLCDFRYSYQHCVGRTADGKVYSWGYNKFGVFGDNRRNDSLHKPKLNKYLKHEFVVDISTGFWHTLALTCEGRVYQFGDNTLCQMASGIDSKSISLKPKLLDAFDGERVVSISSGAFHSLALTESGHVYSWGSNDCGQLGIGKVPAIRKPTPVIVMGLKVAKISTGFDHNLLLSREGYIYTFGCNECGELGQTTKTTEQYLPIRLNHSERFVDIESDNSYPFSAALSESGDYYVWGMSRQHDIHELNTKPKHCKAYESFIELFLEEHRITQRAVHNFNGNKNLHKRLSVQLSHQINISADNVITK